VLLTGLNLAAWAQLSRQLQTPAAVAGYSVGELAGFDTAAGVLDASTALALASTRACAMDRCARSTPGGLLAVSGMASARIERVCVESGAAIAIENDSHAVVLGGPHAALESAERTAQAVGAKCIRLVVGVASHTPWMQAAASEFALALSTLPLRAPRAPLFSNVADRITSGAGHRGTGTADRTHGALERLHGPHSHASGRPRTHSPGYKPKFVLVPDSRPSIRQARAWECSLFQRRGMSPRLHAIDSVRPTLR
jgi:acyl transferase domain-containing protein